MSIIKIVIYIKCWLLSWFIFNCLYRIKIDIRKVVLVYIVFSHLWWWWFRLSYLFWIDITRLVPSVINWGKRRKNAEFRVVYSRSFERRSSPKKSSYCVNATCHWAPGTRHLRTHKDSLSNISLTIWSACLGR